MQTVTSNKSLTEAYGALQKCAVKVDEAIVGACQPLIKFFDSLEPYQKYELLHPRKKPRGSIRRIKKGDL